MNLKTLFVIGICAAAPAVLRGQTLPGFAFNSGDNSFSYDDPDDPGAVVTGYIRKPTTAAANGQAMVICHGKGGSAANFNSQHAANFVTWGFYCIVPQLSHAGAGGGSSSNEGYCPENSRIGRACLKILAATPTVDATRVAIFGHSMGSYFTGGFCGEAPAPYAPIRAAVENAGGCQGSGGNSNFALPTLTEVANITAPMLLNHGTQDATHTGSQTLKGSLDSHAVPNKLLLYQGVPHGIVDANQRKTDVYAISRAWFTTHGVLVFAGNTAPTISAPASVTVTAGVASAPVAVTIGDGQTAVSALTVEAFSLDADVAGTTTPPVPAYSGRLNNSGLIWGGSGANRTLTITPAAGVTGTVEVALVVTDGTASTGQLAAVHYMQVTITADAPTLALAYNTGGTRINVNRNAMAGSSLTATGGTAPYTWSFVSGSLPAGITLNGDGTFSGTSTASGGHTFRARATDGPGATGEMDFSLWVNATRQGTVQTVSFTGPVTGGTVVFSLYLPPGYSGGSTSHPIIYHLHGIGGTHDGAQITTVPVSQEAAVSAGLIEPCIIVFPDGYNDSFWADAVNVVKPAETNIMQEIIPHMEANYRVRPGANHRVIQGFSMGGFGAAKFATKFPDSFACCAVYDGAMLTWAQMQQRHPSQTANIFNNSMATYNDHSAYHWVIQNAATLRVSMPFRDAVGDLVSENQAWKAALDAQSIPSDHIETGLPHSVGPLLDAQGANMWEFIAAALGAGDDFAISFPGSAADLEVTTGVPLNVALSASGGTAPYTWSIVSGALPPGVTLSSAGVLGGTPSGTGAFTFTVQVSDAGGGTDTQQLVLTVNAPPSAGTIPQVSLDPGGNIILSWSATVGAWYQVEVSDNLADWLPLGAAVQATQTTMGWTDDGTLTGTPPAAVDRRFYRVRDFGVFTVNVSGNNFTYTDAQRSVTGILRRPTGGGPFPAVIINHGTSGNAAGYAGARANEMLPWGLVCIGANLTHQDANGPEAELGHSPENHARIEACLAVLASRGYVDMDRVAMFGNSRGSFTAVGSAALLRDRIRAVGICAGGVIEGADTSSSYPTESESSGITAPSIIFHGSNDPVVLPVHSQRLQNLLSTLGVPNNRILHPTTGSAAHNLQNDSTVWPLVLTAWQAWLTTHGVLP